MFLSRRWILILISVTGISFMILLMIQYAWIQKSIETNRRLFASKMMQVNRAIDEAFSCDLVFYEKYLSGSQVVTDLFKGHMTRPGIETAIRYRLDSILHAKQLPNSSALTGRTGNICYLMNEIPPEQHNADIDHSPYKLCLCINNHAVGLDIGFDLSEAESMMEPNTSTLILPSVILILLLIALFAYAIYVIRQQKKIAELKNDFINNLTHEFNTPLFSIGLTSNLLMRSEAVSQSGKLKGYVDLITTEKNRLQAQVDKMLRLTAVESGGLELEKQPVDMLEIINQNVESFKEVAGEKGGTITVQADGDQHIVTGDKVHLFNALSNLLDNAVKYSDKPPEILITTSVSENILNIAVSDNGIGISKPEAKMIFTKFYRVKHGDRHDVKGFGLGLSYVKKIVELHHGTIEVSSVPGKGSTFIIRLPLT